MFTLLSTAQVIEELRADDFEISLTCIKYYVVKSHISKPEKFSTVWVWPRDKIEELKNELISRGRGPKVLAR